MQNLSNKAIVKSFLCNPNGLYVSKYAQLQYNDLTLFSYGKPIAFYDQLVDCFVCYYYPPKPSNQWTVRHLLTFQQEYPQAVKLPTLNATSSETHAFYHSEFVRFPEGSKTRVMLEHDFETAKSYYAAVGVHVPPIAEPLSKDYRKPALSEARSVARQEGYEAVIYKYTLKPDDYFFSGRLYTKFDSLDLIYQNATMCRYYPEHKLFAVRAYDTRPNHNKIINALILHTTPSITNQNKHLLVPEADVPLSDTSKTLTLYAQRLDDMANLLLYYQRDTQTPRAIARRWSQIRAARDTYIKLMHIADINLPTFVPTEEQESYLKRFGAYRAAN